VLGHKTCIALNDGTSRDVEVPEYLIGPPVADELDGGVVQLPQKEGHGATGP
jgi:hypothetical protein